MRKGRAFGSKGELYAKNILIDNFSKLGLYTTIEKIEQYPDNEINENLNVLAKEIKINGITPIDCYVSPRWNDSSIKRGNG